MLTSIGFVALYAALAAGSPVRRSDYAIKETHPVPQKWSRVGPAPADHVIKLQIGLKQGQFDELERHLYEVSDPDHDRYGQHLTADEVNELVKPTDEALELVHQWLLDNGVTSDLKYSVAKDWITVSLAVKQIESLLDTEYSVYGHEDGDYVVRTPEWSLPKHLHEHISVVQPTNSFFRPRQQRSTVKTVDSHQFAAETYIPPTDPLLVKNCNTSLVTPLCLRTLYGTLDYVPQSAGANRMGLNNFLGEANNRSDTKIFLQTYRPEAAGAADTFKTVVIDNGSDQQTPLNSTQLAAGTDLEGNLDSETMLGISYPTPLTTFNTGGSPPYIPDLTTPTDTNEPYLAWLNYVLAQSDTDLPQVISTSYADDEQTIPYSYAVSVCNGFAQLGARGISLFFGSGDSGVGTDGNCFTNDGKNTSTFLAMFPTSCPYITAVGGTKFIPEVVATDAHNGYVSGGGFSRYFPMPEYQKHTIPRYVDSLGSQFAGLYNTAGRGYPDIAAQGYRYATIWNGTLKPLDGTSAATPAAAAVIALVNDARIAAGKSTLGFLNPWLYKRGYKAFNDVHSGSAAGCNTTGFPAQRGWDAVTGFGTPLFKEILKLVIDEDDYVTS